LLFSNTKPLLTISFTSDLNSSACKASRQNPMAMLAHCFARQVASFINHGLICHFSSKYFIFMQFILNRLK